MNTIKLRLNSCNIYIIIAMAVITTGSRASHQLPANGGLTLHLEPHNSGVGRPLWKNEDQFVSIVRGSNFLVLEEGERLTWYECPPDVTPSREKCKPVTGEDFSVLIEILEKGLADKKEEAIRLISKAIAEARMSSPEIEKKLDELRRANREHAELTKSRDANENRMYELTKSKKALEDEINQSLLELAKVDQQIVGTSSTVLKNVFEKTRRRLEDSRESLGKRYKAVTAELSDVLLNQASYGKIAALHTTSTRLSEEVEELRETLNVDESQIVKNSRSHLKQVEAEIGALKDNSKTLREALSSPTAINASDLGELEPTFNQLTGLMSPQAWICTANCVRTKRSHESDRYMDGTRSIKRNQYYEHNVGTVTVTSSRHATKELAQLDAKSQCKSDKQYCLENIYGKNITPAEARLVSPLVGVSQWIHEGFYRNESCSDRNQSKRHPVYAWVCTKGATWAPSYVGRFSEDSYDEFVGFGLTEYAASADMSQRKESYIKKRGGYFKDEKPTVCNRTRLSEYRTYYKYYNLEDIRRILGYPDGK